MSRIDLLKGEIKFGVLAGQHLGGEIIAASGADRSAQLPKGVYRVSADADFWFNVGDLAVTAGPTVDGSAFLNKGEVDFVRIFEDNAAPADARQYIAVNGTGNFSIVKRG
jgi:hypothetical protein